VKNVKKSVKNGGKRLKIKMIQNSLFVIAIMNLKLSHRWLKVRNQLMIEAVKIQNDLRMKCSLLLQQLIK
jgi:hypothetical protein